MTNLNTEVETAKHEKLIKVLYLITICEKRIIELKKMIASKSYNHFLFYTGRELKEQLSHKEAVKAKLVKYYAKLVFALANNAYNLTEPVKPQINSDDMALYTICEDYKQRYQLTNQ